MLVSVCETIVNLEHIFAIYPIDKNVTIEQENERLYFTIESVFGNKIDIEGETFNEVCMKLFHTKISKTNYVCRDYHQRIPLISESQQTTVINTAIANLEKVREKLIQLWNKSKNNIITLTL